MDFLLNMAAGILSIGSWITTNKELVAVVVGGSAGVSLMLEPVKKWWRLQSHTAITFWHYMFALLAAGGHYIATSSSKAPTILFAQALIVLGTNQFVYPLFTKQLSDIFRDAQTEATVSNIEAQVRQVVSDYAG